MDTVPQILISGSSGLIGQALLRHFSAEGLSCVTLTRQPENCGPSSFLWDPYHFEFREEMRRLDGVRAAIHLSGENVASSRWTDSKKRRLRESRILTTRSLVALLRHLDPPPQILLCASGVNYYGDRGDEVLDESSVLGEGFLAELCRDWEAEADAAREFGIRVVNLRFGAVLARNGGILKKMLPLFRMGLGGRLGSGKQWVGWISMRDVARAVSFCMDQSEIDGPVNVTAGCLTNAEFTAALAALVHRPAVLPAPAFALRLVFGDLTDEALLASTRAVPAKLLQTGFDFENPTLAEALRAVLPNRRQQSSPKT